MIKKLIFSFFLMTILLVSLTIATSNIHGGWHSQELDAVEFGMVGRKGNQFMLGGQPFYLNGFNTYWLMILAVDASTRGKVTETFEYASAVGLTVGRTWAFNDGGWRALQKSPSLYDEDVFKTVLNRVNTFTNITYKDDPTIFAWELMNEARCPADSSGNSLQAWIEEMAFYVKTIDPNHLLEVGLEGFYGPSTPDKQQFNPNTFSGQVGTDFIRNHRALGIDFATVHMYPDTWISSVVSNTYLQFVESWMQSHIDDADKMLGMPVVFAEFGVSEKDNNFSVKFRDALINTVYKNIMNSATRGGSGGGCLLWQLFPEGVDYMNDGYSVVLTKYPSTSNIISLQSKRIKIFNSKCSWISHWICRNKECVDALPDEHEEP